MRALTTAAAFRRKQRLVRHAEAAEVLTDQPKALGSMTPSWTSTPSRSNCAQPSTRWPSRMMSIARDPVELHVPTRRRDAEKCGSLCPSHRPSRDDLVLHAEDVPDFHGHVRERRPEAEHDCLEPIATSRVCEVRSDMLFEDGLIPGVPGALDEITHRSDVLVSAHASDAIPRLRLAPGHAGCCIEARAAALTVSLPHR